MNDCKKEISANPLLGMKLLAREALGNKTRQVFSVLKAHYTQYGFVIKDDKQEASMLQHWAKALLVGKVNEEMLRIGLEKAKAYSIEDSFCKWPSIGNFISWCHGIPSPEAAYFETIRYCHDLTEWNPTHAIVALAGRHTGFNDIRNSENQKHYKTEYIRVYCELLVRVLGGEAFTYQKLEKPIAITKKDLTSEDIARNKAQLSKLVAMVAAEEKQKSTEVPVMTKEQVDEKKEKIRAQANEWLAKRGGK